MFHFDLLTNYSLGNLEVVGFDLSNKLPLLKASLVSNNFPPLYGKLASNEERFINAIVLPPVVVYSKFYPLSKALNKLGIKSRVPAPIF